MGEFHRQRAAGTPKEVALRAAQLSLIEAGRAGREVGGAPVSHPYFWAPFVLVGDWR